MRRAVQSCGSPLRQLAQLPQVTVGQQTIASPRLTPATPAPISTTRPENSCPMVTGSAAAMNS